MVGRETEGKIEDDEQRLEPKSGDADERSGFRSRFDAIRRNFLSEQTLDDRIPEERFPSDYIKPEQRDVAALAANVAEHGRNYQRYLELVNPHYADGAHWQQNCGPCARAFADTYQGAETRVAAGIATGGEDIVRMREWTGIDPSSSLLMRDTGESAEHDMAMAWSRIDARARDLPDGTVLIIGFDQAPDPDGNPRGGHWFNAVRVDGSLRWVDAQNQMEGPWPPTPYRGSIATVDATYRTTASAKWKELGLAD